MLSFQHWRLLSENEEFIKPNDYDIQKKYDYYNHKLFEGKLPKIKLGWSNKLKIASGITKYKFIPKRIPFLGGDGKLIMSGGEAIVSSMSLTLNGTMYRTEQEYDAILIHEMIHVWFAIIGDVRQSHGSRFRQMCQDLSQKVGFTISITDDVSPDRAHEKFTNVQTILLLHNANNTYTIAIYSVSGKASRDFEGMKSAIDRRMRLGKYTNGWIYSAVTMLSGSIPISKSLPPRTMYVVKPESIKHILEKGVVKYDWKKETQEKMAA